MEIKKIKIKNERRGSKSEPKMRYFKIPLCRNFVWKVGDYSGPKDVCQWCLRSKNGVWHIRRMLNNALNALVKEPKQVKKIIKSGVIIRVNSVLPPVI